MARFIIHHLLLSEAKLNLGIRGFGALIKMRETKTMLFIFSLQLTLIEKTPYGTAVRGVFWILIR